MNLDNLVELSDIELVEYDGVTAFSDGYILKSSKLLVDSAASYYVFKDEKSARLDDINGLVGTVTNTYLDEHKLKGDLYLSRNFYFSDIKTLINERYINAVIGSIERNHDTKTIELGEVNIFFISHYQSYEGAKDLRKHKTTKTKLNFDQIYYT